MAIALKSEEQIKAYKISADLKHLLDQYADDLTVYLERSSLQEQNYANINAVLKKLEEFRILSGLKANRGKTMLTVFGNRDDDSLLCDELGIKWCTRFKLLGIWFDQTLDDMMINSDIAKKKVKEIANSWRNRYVSIYGKVCVVNHSCYPK